MLIAERQIRKIINHVLLEAITEDSIRSSIKSFEFQPEIAESVIAVKLLQEKIQSSLKIDSKTLCLLLKAALAISGRESSYGEGSRYKYTSWAETLISQLYNSSITPKLISATDTSTGIIPKLISAADMSIGPTQVKYGANLGPGTELAAYASQVGITNAASLSEYPKAIMATIGMLAKLYQKAVELGYTNEPGVTSKTYKSTGSAALDLAIIGYNMGPTKITNYCGTQDVKKPCAPGSPDIVKNYIPNLADSSITSFGYIGEVSADMTNFSKIDTLF